MSGFVEDLAPDSPLVFAREEILVSRLAKRVFRAYPSPLEVSDARNSFSRRRIARVIAISAVHSGFPISRVAVNTIRIRRLHLRTREQSTILQTRFVEFHPEPPFVWTIRGPPIQSDNRGPSVFHFSFGRRGSIVRSKLALVPRGQVGLCPLREVALELRSPFSNEKIVRPLEATRDPTARLKENDRILRRHAVG